MTYERLRAYLNGPEMKKRFSDYTGITLFLSKAQPEEIQVTIPENAASGPILVTTVVDSVKSPQSFTVTGFRSHIQISPLCKVHDIQWERQEKQRFLHHNGRYGIGSEKGTFSVKGNKVILSESKIRGPGQNCGAGKWIRAWFSAKIGVAEDAQQPQGASTQFAPPACESVGTEES